jgi:hypothetical protein
MNDRELLRLAGKACGELGPSWFDNDAYFDGVLTRWNPLTDDGDALRLAHALGMQLNLKLSNDMNDVRSDIVMAAAAIGAAL